MPSEGSYPIVGLMQDSCTRNTRWAVRERDRSLQDVDGVRPIFSPVQGSDTHDGGRAFNPSLTEGYQT